MDTLGIATVQPTCDRLTHLPPASRDLEAVSRLDERLEGRPKASLPHRWLRRDVCALYKALRPSPALLIQNFIQPSRAYAHRPLTVAMRLNLERQAFRLNHPAHEALWIVSKSSYTNCPAAGGMRQSWGLSAKRRCCKSSAMTETTPQYVPLAREQCLATTAIL